MWLWAVHPLGDVQENIFCSAGMAVYGRDTENVYELIEYADFAMYEAKKAGKTRSANSIRNVQENEALSALISTPNGSGTERGSLPVVSAWPSEADNRRKT